MASSGHTAAQRTALQADYTTKVATAAAAVALGASSVAAWANEQAKNLQLVVTREQGAPLS